MLILRGQHGKIQATFNEKRGRWRARMKYKTLYSDETHSMGVFGTSKGRAENALKDKWADLSESWNRGPAEAERITAKDLLNRWYPTVASPQRHGKQTAQLEYS